MIKLKNRIWDFEKLVLWRVNSQAFRFNWKLMYYYKFYLGNPLNTS
jgi:hypothetical protein